MFLGKCEKNNFSIRFWSHFLQSIICTDVTNFPNCDESWIWFKDNLSYLILKYSNLALETVSDSTEQDRHKWKKKSKSFNDYKPQNGFRCTIIYTSGSEHPVHLLPSFIPVY